MNILIQPHYYLPALEKTRVRAAIEHFIKTGEGNLRIGRHIIAIHRRGNRHFVIVSGLVNDHPSQSLATVLEDGENQRQVRFEMKTILKNNYGKKL